MSEDRTHVDQALDLFVFAPVGLALTVREAMPSLVARGRQQVEMQTTLAKMVGQFAVQQGQKEAAKAIDGAVQQATALFEQLVGGGATQAPAHDHVAGNGSAPSAPPPAGTTIPVQRYSAPPPPARSSGPAAAELAIPDYDSLAASQVVPRLSGLTADELEQVRVYEVAHRSRKTILNRIAQLQTDA